jgi:tetratricopeptide (TPR) repeat protein
MNQEELLRSFQDNLHSVLAEKVKAEGRGNTTWELNKAVEEDMKKLMERASETKKGPLPGLQEETKKAKDALTADPFDLSLIHDLGCEYIKEEKWPEATNVLIRGWKRVGEFSEPADRSLYLYQLCEASFACRKYKQAHAVLMDMEEPQDPEFLVDYCVLQCKVFCENGELQKALKAFHKAIDSTTVFDNALHVWSQTLSGLKKVGAYEAAKSAIERKATTNKQQDSLKAVATVTDLKDSLAKSEKQAGTPKFLLVSGWMAMLSIIVWALWFLEERSLKAMNMK